MNSNEWDIFKKSVKPLKVGKNIISTKKNHPETFIVNDKKMEAIEGIDIKVSESWGDLEKNILKKINKGNIKVSAKLDLHGFTVNEAKKLVFEFINSNYINSNRLVLIISGKGKRLPVRDGWQGTGKLKSNIPNWLNSMALNEKIIWFDYAPQNKGGKGAFLIYLKKLK